MSDYKIEGDAPTPMNVVYHYGDLSIEDKARENHARYQLSKLGCKLRRGHGGDRLGYLIVARDGTVAAGAEDAVFTLTLDAVEKWVQDNKK